MKNEETRRKTKGRREIRENPKIHPELIKYYITDEQRIIDSWKDEIGRTLRWPKKVKEVNIKRKEKRKEDLYHEK